LSWIHNSVTTDRDLLARVRYRDSSTPIHFKLTENGGADLTFTHTQRGLAAGQVLALYDGPVLLGGGIFY